MVKWYTKTMETLKDLWKLPEGKILLIFLGLVLGGMAAEQVWWTNYAPKGTTRCVESFTGIVCTHKK